MLSFPPNGTLPPHGAPLDIKAEARVPMFGYAEYCVTTRKTLANFLYNKGESMPHFRIKHDIINPRKARFWLCFAEKKLSFHLDITLAWPKNLKGFVCQVWLSIVGVYLR